MLVKTGGIVIKNTKYSDSSIISKIYTRTLGMQTYMINGVRAPKAAIKPSLLQPLVLLDLVVYLNPVKNIQRIKEARPNPTLQNLHFDILKSSTGLFVAELLYRTVKEEEPNTRLYDFVEKFVLYTDEATENLSVLPLFFILQMSRFLGFFPHAETGFNNQYFNLTEGVFTEFPEYGANSIEPKHGIHLHRLLHANFENLVQVKIPRVSRAELLSKMVDYYILHIPGFYALKSLPVLAAMMKED